MVNFKQFLKILYYDTPWSMHVIDSIHHSYFHDATSCHDVTSDVTVCACAMGHVTILYKMGCHMGGVRFLHLGLYHPRLSSGHSL